ncbi:hypothetical protein ACFFK7_14150 [Pseudoalteromonas xiamenensis]|uniref:hypothetical protein n=1 Tax=Pseudoalteromonas xiamenensis TaxID=882626 RepID=UPI0035E91B11
MILYRSLLLAVILFALSGCGGDSDTPTSPVIDQTQLDTDKDGVLDKDDAFPSDPTETIDTDKDGIGNNADTDDDNDGVADEQDAFPLDPVESLDTDLDGIGNNVDTDDDNDGVADDQDAFPLDPAESADTDSDGVGDNADAYPNDSACFVATDGDGNACYLSLLAQDTELKVAKSAENFFIYSPQVQKIVELSGQTEQVVGVYQPNPAKVVAHLAYSDTMGLLVSYAEHAEIDAFDRLGTRSQFATLSENNAHILPMGRFVYFVTQNKLSGWDQNGENVHNRSIDIRSGIESSFVDGGQNRAIISYAISGWRNFRDSFTIDPVTGLIQAHNKEFVSEYASLNAIALFDDYIVTSLGTYSSELSSHTEFGFGLGAKTFVVSAANELAMLRHDGSDTQFTRFSIQFNMLDQVTLNGSPVDMLITGEHAVVLTKAPNRLMFHRLVLSNDVDNDGVLNADDAFPKHPEASLDADKDGYPDSWNEGADASATTLQLDAFPKDALCWLAEHANSDGLCDYASFINAAYITDMVQSEEGILYLLDSTRALVYPFDSRTGRYLPALVVGKHNQLETVAPTSMTYVDGQERLYFLNRDGIVKYFDENNVQTFFTKVSADTKLFAAEKYLLVPDYTSTPDSITSYRKNGEVTEKNNFDYLYRIGALKWNKHTNELLALSEYGYLLDRLSLNLLSGEISELDYYPINIRNSKPDMSLSEDGNLVAVNTGVLFDIVNEKALTNHQGSLDMHWYQDNQYLVVVNHDGVHRVNRYNTSTELLESRELVGTLVKLVKLGNKLYILENQNGLLIINEFIANDDSDGDGVINTQDAFPNDVAASLDSDSDGFPDAWNEGYSEADSTRGLILDSFPNDSACWQESHDDGNGMCNVSATVPEYVPTITANGRPGELFMLSPENHRIYRWSLESNGYISPIVLPQVGRFAHLDIVDMAYSDKLDRIYLIFKDTLDYRNENHSVGYIDLNHPNQLRVFSDNVDLRSGALIPIGDYLLSNNKGPLMIFNASGEVVHTAAGKYISTGAALDKNRNVLFRVQWDKLVRAQFNPTTETLDDLNTNISDWFPDAELSLSPSGNKLAESKGRIFDATTLEQLREIEPFKRLVWLNDEQYLIITQDSDKIVLKNFFVSNSKDVLIRQDELPGQFIHFAQIDNRVVILAKKDNNSHFYLYELNGDVDGDGVQNHVDAYPFDAAASVDTDGDGYPDAWNAGYSSADSTSGLILDSFPNDLVCWLASHDDGSGQCNYAASVPSYVPTQVAIDNQGMVYLLNREENRIYRWSTAASQYRNPILVDKFNPTDSISIMTYSAAHNRLYLAYFSGDVSYIDLTEGKTEVPLFHTKPIDALTAAGDYLIVRYHDFGNERYIYMDGVFNSNGDVVYGPSWDIHKSSCILGRHSFSTWNANTNRMYYIIDEGHRSAWTDHCPRGQSIIAQEIDQTTGSLSSVASSVHYEYSNSVEPIVKPIVGPIKVVNNGTEVILGNGRGYVSDTDSKMLTESYNLGFGFSDLIETDAQFVAAVAADENTELVFVDKQSRRELVRIAIEFTVKQMYLVGNKLILVKDAAGDTEFETITLVDDDQDGLPVWWEQAFGLSDNNSSDAQSDDDNDGLSALDEYTFTTKPNVFDTDGDGLGDGAEINTHLTSPLSQDTDNDGLSDGEEVNTYFTSPVNSDSDGDGFSDGNEVSLYHTDPNDPEAKPAPTTTWSENFESGQKPSNMTTPSTSNAAWSITEEKSVQGRYSLGSGAISVDQTSMVELRGFFAAGTFTFDALVSSESYGDYLSVTINGEQVRDVGKSDSWATYSFSIEPGEHVIRWTYAIKYVYSSGNDKAYIDNLNFVAN